MPDRRSLTTRLTVLFASVSTGVLLLLGLIIGILVEDHFEELDRVVLDAHIEHLRQALQKIHRVDDWAGLPAQMDATPHTAHDLSLIVVSPAGQTLFVRGSAAFPAKLLAVDADGQPTHRELQVWNDGGERKLRSIVARLETGEPTTPSVLAGAAIDIGHHQQFMRSFHVALWSVVSLAALLSGFLGWLVARRGLAPLEEMRRKAADITANRLNQRLSTASIPVELAEVARTLDEMLARLQDSFRRLSDFSSDLAHELRTPVSNLLMQTQVMLAHPRSNAAYRDVLASNLEEYDRLSRTIGDMLFLAKAEHGLIVPQDEAVDLACEVSDLCEFYEPLAEEKALALQQTGEATVRGDRLMLRRALSNLLSNAIGHAPAQSTIGIGIEQQTTQARVEFVNRCRQAPAEPLERLFDRFYRADPARRDPGDGAGLGLAITRSIARAHGGEVSAEWLASPKGEIGDIRFILQLPLQALSVASSNPHANGNLR